MQEDRTPNESALELRLKQVIRYVSIALVAILAICGLMFAYITSIKQSEKAALDTSQAQAQTAVQSDLCKVYPATDVCVLSREVLANPAKTVAPVPEKGDKGEPGKPGQNGQDGRGVTDFTTDSKGDLIVTYTDGQTRNAGHVVGKDGAIGPTGNGILSTGLQNGSLIINYTDGRSENVGYIVGPAGKDGEAGQNGVNGTNGVDGKDGLPGKDGKDGISVTGILLDSTNTVIVSYSDGRSQVAGQLVINTIKYTKCENDTFTIGMVDGTAFSTTVDCTPDNFPLQGPATNNTVPTTIK